MLMFGGKELPLGTAFKDKNNVSRPAIWTSVASPEELSSAGVEVHPDPPEPSPPAPRVLSPIESLVKTDGELILIAARMIEDIAEERIAAGKYVSDGVKEKIAERKSLREKI